MTQVANGNATKIIVPSELQNFATAGMVFGEMLGKPPVPPTPIQPVHHNVAPTMHQPKAASAPVQKPRA